MKRVVLLLLVVLVLPACSSLQLRSVRKLRDNVERQQADHMSLMGGRDADDRNDWDLHYRATFHVIDELEEQAEPE